MYAVIYWDNFSKKYEIYGGLADMTAVKNRLARLSCGNPFFSGYVATDDNAQYVADYVNLARSVQVAGGQYPYTAEQDEEFGGRFVGSVTYRKTSHGRVGFSTPNWKWSSGIRR